MKNRALVSCVAAAFALAACSSTQLFGGGTPPTKAAAQHCYNSAKCTITVTVTSCTPDGVSVDADWHIWKRNVVLEWVLDNASVRKYQFDTTTGIAFKDDPTWPWQNEFHSPSSNGKKFMWHDDNSKGVQGRVYKYGLTILNADGTPCVHVDPIVINDA